MVVELDLQATTGGSDPKWLGLEATTRETPYLPLPPWYERCDFDAHCIGDLFATFVSPRSHLDTLLARAESHVALLTGGRSMSQHEIRAIVVYTLEAKPYGFDKAANLFARLNAFLRNRTPLLQNTEENRLLLHFHTSLCSALNKIRPERCTLYRHVKRLDHVEDFQRGARVCFPAFTSTSHSELAMYGFCDPWDRPCVHMTIHAINARDVCAFSLVPKEFEYVLPPNSMFQVDSNAVDEQGIRRIVLQQLDTPVHADLIAKVCEELQLPRVVQVPPHIQNPLPRAVPVTVRIGRGQTLSKIALQHNVAVQEIAAANGITNVHKIYAEHQLKIPVARQFDYVIQPNDRWWAICKRTGCTDAELRAANPHVKNTDLIYAGDGLKSPPGKTIPPPNRPQPSSVARFAAANPGVAAAATGAALGAVAAYAADVVETGDFWSATAAKRVAQGGVVGGTVTLAQHVGGAGAAGIVGGVAAGAVTAYEASTKWRTMSKEEKTDATLTVGASTVGTAAQCFAFSAGAEGVAAGIAGSVVAGSALCAGAGAVAGVVGGLVQLYSTANMKLEPFDHQKYDAWSLVNDACKGAASGALAFGAATLLTGPIGWFFAALASGVTAVATTIAWNKAEEAIRQRKRTHLEHVAKKLSVSPTATEKEFEHGVRRKRLEFHPDKSKADTTELFKEIASDVATYRFLRGWDRNVAEQNKETSTFRRWAAHFAACIDTNFRARFFSTAAAAGHTKFFCREIHLSRSFDQPPSAEWQRIPCEVVGLHAFAVLVTDAAAAASSFDVAFERGEFHVRSHYSSRPCDSRIAARDVAVRRLSAGYDSLHHVAVPATKGGASGFLCWMSDDSIAKEVEGIEAID